METSKLYSIVNDLIIKIKSSNILKTLILITQTSNKLIQSAQSPNNIKQPISDQLTNLCNEIVNLISTFIPTPLSIEDDKIYQAINAYNLFGFEGQKRINNIPKEILVNPKNITIEIANYQSDVNKLIDLHKSLSSFSEIFQIEDTHSQNNDSIKIIFQGEAEINNLDELAKVSSKWNKDLIAFALLTKENDRTFRIEAVERGSIILILTAIAGIVCAFGKAANYILDTIKKYYEIKIFAHNAKLLQGKIPERTIQDLEDSSKLKIKTETNEITKKLVEEYGWNEVENRKDVNNAIGIAIRHILEFIHKGGKVEIKLVNDNNDEKVEQNLILKYNEIKQFENKIALIEGQKPMLELTDKFNDEENVSEEKIKN